MCAAHRGRGKDAYRRAHPAAHLPRPRRNAAALLHAKLPGSHAGHSAAGTRGLLKLRAPYAHIAATLAAGLLVASQAGSARADYAKEQLGAVARPAEDQGRPRWMQKMAGSSLDLSTYVGSGTFYNSGYYNRYISNALFVRPTYDLGTRFKLSLNARVYVEQEYTRSDLPNGRGFNPYDLWFWLSAKEVHKFERSKIRVGATARVVVPISYESRYANMVTGLGVGPSLTRTFVFGSSPVPERRWNLTTNLSSIFTKYVYTSELRGSRPGDTTGCRPYLAAGLATGSAGGPAASESDRCGGALNTNFSFTTAGTVALTRSKWSLTTILLISNAFRYRVAANVEANLAESDIGRADATWGIVSLGYSFTEHLGISGGISSFQPALDRQYRSLRFPFFDFSGTNANNYTQVFLSLSGTL